MHPVTGQLWIGGNFTRADGLTRTGLARLDASEVSYKSAPDALTDLAAGRLDFLFTDWGSARPFSVGWWAVAGDMFDAGGVILPRGALIRLASSRARATPPTSGEITISSSIRSLK